MNRLSPFSVHGFIAITLYESKHYSVLDSEPLLISNLSDPNLSHFQIYLIPNLSDSKPIYCNSEPIRWRTYLIPIYPILIYPIPNLSDSETIWFWTYPIPNLSDSEPI